ncbi:MAG: autotransporter domain-containing protein [Mailhella sp.]|nr:autotransporter domain-containing protein [Mailhella sp.]
MKVTGLERDDQQLNLANAELGSLDVANSTFTVNGVASGENPTALKIGKLSASEAAELNLNSDSVTVTDSFSVASGAKVAAEKLVLEKTGVVDGGELTADTLSLSCDTVDLIKSVAAVNELDMQAGTLAVEESDVTVGTLTSAGGTVGLNKSVAAVDTLDMQGGTLNIIDSDVTIGTLKTAGGTIFIDPSNVKVGDLEGKLDADFFIGEGSTVDFGGADMSSAPAVSDKTAVLALGPGKSIEVDKGSLEVNGALTGTAPTPPAPGTVKFAADSLFVVDGATEGGVIRGSGGALTVEDGAKLHINNARVGEFVVASNFDPNAITVGGWNGSNLTLTTSNVLTEAVAATPDGDDVIVSIVAKDAASVFPDLRPVRNVDTMMAEGQNDTSDDAPAGIRMLSRALEKTASPDSIDAVNEASSAAVTVGVQNTALRIADAASNTVIGHLSLAQHDGSRAIHADGADFWAAPMYGNLYTSGMAAGGQSVRGQFGGLALGADVEAGQFLGGKFRIGASINGGGGQSETSGTATSAQNDYDFGGLNFYAGWNNGALNLMASVGYAFGNHEVEMGLPASLGMSSAKADVDTAAFTADLRAEYQLKTGWLDVLPHVGVRYTALRTDAHDLKSGGEVLNSVERDTQNIVQFPIGVTLSRDFDLAGWALKPAVDLSFIPAAGDKDARTSVNFSGIDAVDSFDTRIMDSTSWAATVGVQAEKGAFSLGLNYGVQASSHETDQNVQLKLGWKF